MMNLPKFRYSFLTLFLVFTLAVVGTSHWRTARELSAARRELALAQRSLADKSEDIRDLSNKLGELTLSDPRLVHIISASEIWKEGYFQNGRPPLELSWRLHLPVGTRWNVWWATTNIPAEGFPDDPQGGMELDPIGNREALLTVQFVNTPVTKWDLIVSGVNRSEFSPIPTSASGWLTDQKSVSWTGPGGDQHQAPTTETFPPDQPIVIQRIRRWVDRGDFVEVDPKPAEGFMIWIEPVRYEPHQSF